jgi:hypothetical protein
MEETAPRHPALVAFAREQGYAYVRQLPDGRLLAVGLMTFGKARLHLCTQRDIVDSW